jgi:glutamyl/glutaminyl-tRNA synthetase
LCWLDARSLGARLVLRLEDLDTQRSRPDLARAMCDDLAWLGLDWDEVRLQSDYADAHAQALDQLEQVGALYPCACSRKRIREQGRPAPDGGFAYDNRCRDRTLPAGGWRASEEPLRARLPEGRIEPFDEGGEPLAQDPGRELGDPLVRRRDGGIAYQLASVVDDAAAAVTRVVRGRDLAASSATQAALGGLLGLREPRYRHHLLLLEERGDKLAKLHGAVAASDLRARYAGDEVCGVLAHACGLRADAARVLPAQLLDDFSWERVARGDRIMRWTGEALISE